MRLPRSPSLKILVVVSLALGASSCASAYRQTVAGNGLQQVFAKTFVTDFNTAWQACLDSLKSIRLDISNREGGFIQTRWTENTAEKNFTDSFGGADAYLKAQYRVRVNVSKGFYNGTPTVKVSVQREQLIQRDVLEGWRPIETDSIEENTLLYRIGRIIYIKMKIAKIEEEKTRREIEKSGF